MKDDLIKDIIQEMLPFLNNAQGEKLRDVLQYTFAKYEINGKVTEDKEVDKILWSVFVCKKNRRLFREVFKNIIKQLLKLCLKNSTKRLNT